MLERQKKRREIGVPLDAFLLTSVGELNENKNHSVVIRAVAKTGQKDIHYAIAGKGNLMEGLKALAEELGINDRVHILGFRSDISELYHASDVCVFPSIREGLGLAAVEGMASGLPLIVSDNRGTRGFVGPDNGITCRHDNVDGFADGIMKLKDDLLLCRRLSQVNEIDNKKFDKTVVNAAMRKIYMSI